MQKINFHTHTKRCKHAFGEDEQYVQAAIAHGIIRLGFSDHAPFPDGRWSFSRMSYQQLPGYCQSIRQLAEKYREQIEIELGLEIEYDSSQLHYYSQLLEQEQLDYLLLAQHYFIDMDDQEHSSFQITRARDLELYAYTLIEAMETGIFAFVAHPDVMFNSYPAWDHTCEKVSRAILQAAQDLQLPLELNANGIRKGYREFADGERHPYPHPSFWELAQQYDVPVIINSDCHHYDEMFDAAMEQAYIYAQKWQLRLVTIV
ncbi:MAG: histidinol-phosphatase [Culicoidibacterales bacterium]